jgi:4-amino-4-deoxy-L-arabinose transferase-like glycosyltransferase
MPRPAPATVADVSELSPSGPYRSLKQFGLVLLCATWIVLGLVGHDPWKSDDATAFGVTWAMMQGGSVLTPTLAGEAWIEQPPLVYAVAAGFGTALSPWLPAHDAARVAAGAFLGLVLWLIGLTARELGGRQFTWLPVLVFIGSVGLWDRADQLSPELGLMLGVAVAQCGFALALRRPAAGGALLGIGAAVAFLSRGFLGPIWLALTAIVLPIAFSGWRTRAFATTTGVALAVALPVAGAWPLALAVSAPAHLGAWWADQSPGDYFAPLATVPWSDPLFVWKNLPWFAWPALPLTLWTLWTRGRGFNGGLGVPAIELPGVLTLVIVASITMMPEPRAIYLMPLLVPMCLLASWEVDTLKRGFSGALDWFGILTFGLLAGIVWWLWIDATLHGMAPRIARLFRDTEAGYRPVPQALAMTVSVFLSVLWLMLVRPARRSNRRAVLNWAAGMTLLWGLYSTIWLPYLDSRRSYRSVAEALAPHLPTQGCVASRNLGDPQRALFHYFVGLTTIRSDDERAARCDALLVQYGRRDDAPVPLPGWEIAWDGRRRGDDTEHYVLFVKASASAPSAADTGSSG